jgi:carbon-monoxide dehydrogenase large subunit
MIGASPKNKDARRLLEGRGHYVDDLHRPGCAYLAVVRSQHAHARIVGVDGAAAAAIPGVLAVWTARELPEAQRPLTSASTGVHAERPFVAPILVSERVRYVGEPVAIVVAETPYVLADALAAVTVDYEPLPPIVGDEAARAN